MDDEQLERIARGMQQRIERALDWEALRRMRPAAFDGPDPHPFEPAPPWPARRPTRN